MSVAVQTLCYTLQLQQGTSSMRLVVLAAAVATAASMGCRSGPSDDELTTALFEPAYRAAKAVQGATESGVVLNRYSELL